jgi:diguanylate cyclase (GGDEF)-like protein
MLTLFDLARGLNNQMSVQDAGDVIAKHLRRLVPTSLLVFFLYDSDSDELVAAHASGEHAGLVSDLRIGVGQRLSGWVAAHRQVIRNSDPVLDFGDALRSMAPRPRSCLSIPLTVRGGLVGVLSLYSTGLEAFTEDHQRIVEVVSKQVSTILQSAADFDRTKSRSLRDQLTGLPNIDHLYQLTNSYSSADPAGEPFSILVLDIDDLAEINSNFGHVSGDQVLARVVRATRRSLRGADFLFRYRDDEFIVLLLQTDHDTSGAVVRRIAEALQREASAMGPPFTVTIGAATAPRDAQTIGELIELAGVRLNKPDKPDSRPGSSESIH